MSQVDKYLELIDDALANKGELDALDLVEEVTSVFIGVIPEIKQGLDRYKGRVVVAGSQPKYDTVGDLRKLRGKLLSYKEAERSRLTDNPLMLALLKVESDIEKCSGALLKHDYSECEKLVEKMVKVYETDIDQIYNGLSQYGFSGSDNRPIEDLELIIEKLKQHRVRIALNYSRSGSLAVSVNNSASASSTASAIVNVTQVSEQVQSLPQSVLGDMEKNQLQLLLLELDRNKVKSKVEVTETIQKLLFWLSDKGIDVLIATFPYIVSILQTI